MNQEIAQNMDLVNHIVNKFSPRGSEERDRFIQAGRIGLWKALQKHESKKGKLSTLAYRGIWWEILKEIKQTQPIAEKNLPNLFFYENKTRELDYNKLDTFEVFILNMRKQGFTFQEISYVVDLSYYQVYKVYRGLIKKLNVET